MNTPTYRIKVRSKTLVNHDPLRRCYNGCYKDARWEWGSWQTLESGIPEEQLPDRLAFWRDLNDYAVSQRGGSARKAFASEVESG